jgi:hypothetical protein
MDDSPPPDDDDGMPPGDSGGESESGSGSGDEVEETSTSQPGAGGGDSDGEMADQSLSCPDCGESLPGGARFCPYCSTAIAEDGGTVDLSELDADIIEDPAEFLVEDEEGNRQANGPIRALSGLAVAIPLAPLILFLVSSVVSLSIWAAGMVFITGWIVPAAILSRSRVPAEAFGRSLFLIGICTLLVPLVVRDDSGLVNGSGMSFEAVAGLSMVISIVAIGLGVFVSSQARKRVSGERRGFEDLREE